MLDRWLLPSISESSGVVHNKAFKSIMMRKEVIQVDTAVDAVSVRKVHVHAKMIIFLSVRGQY